MRYEGKQNSDKALKKEATPKIDPKETYITETNLSIMSLESLLKLFCGIDK